MAQKRSRRVLAATSWEPVADWYVGWAGTNGSEHHRRLAIPAVLELLAPIAGEHMLDLGCGPGVLVPAIARTGAHYTGVDLSARMLEVARRQHGRHAEFLLGDATRLNVMPELRANSFAGVVFLLSIQDIDPLDAALRSAAWALQPGGRAVLVMTHPCFRMPRQSGWGWDDTRKLCYRRIDRYLTPLAVPMKTYPGGKGGATRSFHRPLEAYVNGLAASGLLVDCVREIPTYKVNQDGVRARAENLANQEIPLFLALRARKSEQG
jgi:ubiquinone/menaquinone biosynthesis C-methylase UbiE